MAKRKIQFSDFSLDATFQKKPPISVTSEYVLGKSSELDWVWAAGIYVLMVDPNETGNESTKWKKWQTKLLQ